MTGRVAFLPTPGDPFLIKLWLKYYKVWANDIDKLYIHLNNVQDKRIYEYVKNLAKEYDNIEIIYRPEQIEHGDALAELTTLVNDPYVMFIEDDAFIIKPGVVDKCFKSIEDGDCDAVGSKRACCSTWLYEKLSDMFVIDNSGFGDHGPNFWPNFFFVKHKDLMATNLKFGAKLWPKGSYVKEVNEYAPEDQASDTFVWGSMQLRNMDLKFKIMPQYHGNTDDVSDYVRTKNIWDGHCPWFHVGSLSSGFHGLLDLKRELPDGFKTDQEKLELERRMVFWDLAYKEAIKDNYIPDIKTNYLRALERIYQKYSLNKNNMIRRQAMYKEVMDAYI